MKCPEQASLQRHKTDKWLPGAVGGRNEEQLFSGYCVQFWNDENMLDEEMMITAPNVLNATELYNWFKMVTFM